MAIIDSNNFDGAVVVELNALVAIIWFRLDDVKIFSLGGEKGRHLFYYLLVGRQAQLLG